MLREMLKDTSGRVETGLVGEKGIEHDRRG